MAHGLDSQEEWQRLYERYHAMSDGELVELAAGIDGLTEVAGDALRREMRERRLEVAAADVPGPVSASGADGAGRFLASDGDVGQGDLALMIFYDAIDAGRACDFLEEQDVDFQMQDVSRPRSGLGMLESPPVSLRLVVRKADRERAMGVLRAKMGLFPLQEVGVSDESIDDGTVISLGLFGELEEADEVARVLEEAGVWHRVVKNPEGTVEQENCYSLEVREVDLVRAGDVVEAGLELPEE